jgi:WD40-like Beta Propeller Repeat
MIADADGRNERPLVPHGYDNFPKWQPHGDRILFTSDRDGRFELYTMRPDGSDVKRLTNAEGSSAHSSWSPDGQWTCSPAAARDKPPESEAMPSEALPVPLPVPLGPAESDLASPVI